MFSSSSPPGTSNNRRLGLGRPSRASVTTIASAHQPTPYAVTVGSLAHAQAIQSVVRVNEPSPFTRKGPGPSYIVKPDIVTYGGNCDHAGNYQTTGIRSLDPVAQIAEDVGTSFAAPFATSLLANVFTLLIRRHPSTWPRP